MKILITGSSGLVGSAIQRILRENKNENKNENIEWIFASSKDCDLRDEKATSEFFEKIRPDIVLHLAGNVGGLYKNIRDKSQMFLDNLRMNSNVLENSKKVNVKKCISILSTCIFPDGFPDPLTAKDIHKGPPHPSNAGYAYAKRMLQVQSELYREEGLNTLCVIPCNLYGLEDNFDIQTGHVIACLLKKAVQTLQKNESVDTKSLVVLGDGSAKRQFLFADDFAQILLHLLEVNLPEVNPLEVNLPEVNPLNEWMVCPPEEYTIQQVVEMIARLVEKHCSTPLSVVYKHTESNGQSSKYATNDYPFSFTSLEQGLEKTFLHLLEKENDNKE